MPTWRIEVRGRVQGVGFRHYVTLVADEMQLSGEVYNRPDGSVMIAADLDGEAEVQEFVAALHRGPGKIAAVRWDACESSHGYAGFEITRTRP